MVLANTIYFLLHYVFLSVDFHLTQFVKMESGAISVLLQSNRRWIGRPNLRLEQGNKLKVVRPFFHWFLKDSIDVWMLERVQMQAVSHKIWHTSMVIQFLSRIQNSFLQFRSRWQLNQRYALIKSNAYLPILPEVLATQSSLLYVPFVTDCVWYCWSLS